MAIVVSALGESPEAAVGCALFLHPGTGVAAATYYREDPADLLGRAPEWRPGSALGEHAELTFLGLATAVSAFVGGLALLALEAVATAPTGGTFVALVGPALVATGPFQRTAAGQVLDPDRDPSATDAVLVGSLQGLAVLPGVSRSGVTTGALLLWGHESERAFRLSVLLSVPAALGAGVSSVAAAGGVPAVGRASGVTALVVAGVVGYATIGVLLRVVRRIPFRSVCVGLGLLRSSGPAWLSWGPDRPRRLPTRKRRPERRISVRRQLFPATLPSVTCT